MTNAEVRKRLLLWSVGKDEILDAIINLHLEEHEREMLHLRYMCGLSWKDVGKRMYLTCDRAKHIEYENILPRIKEAMNARSNH